MFKIMSLLQATQVFFGPSLPHGVFAASLVFHSSPELRILFMMRLYFWKRIWLGI